MGIQGNYKQNRYKQALTLMILILSPSYFNGLGALACYNYELIWSYVILQTAVMTGRMGDQHVRRPLPTENNANTER
jgi:hypothetical protein